MKIYVETEAEIAKREGRDYETAEVLLEKIKAEKGNKEKNDNIAVFSYLIYFFFFLRKGRPLRGR
ncbi:Type I restriction-modification system, specificity subunit S [Methanosarcina barkeri str. Wiesmoor]|uniref:Type I restriction-modification system, specificity subunit S n=2 Tax=Methanosarcina barkeri TaxID=2208 RepID=A0A0E3LLS3_METBA|nr:hypothetical protein [Methanosarcina barkeri]AKB51771.1 Type I restriction-modification system, specificity subunit S [Methanosarcina barkeri str. Wiesmoor]